ncbi:hypothetical protein B0T13DRAFT_199323 [Neurospora crassa]|nr:hypothetical protein B0T13DRAFT_199323 [Neurospora crassa]
MLLLSLWQCEISWVRRGCFGYWPWAAAQSGHIPYSVLQVPLGCGEENHSSSMWVCNSVVYRKVPTNGAPAPPGATAAADITSDNPRNNPTKAGASVTRDRILGFCQARDGRHKVSLLKVWSCRCYVLRTKVRREAITIGLKPVLSRSQNAWMVLTRPAAQGQDGVYPKRSKPYQVFSFECFGVHITSTALCSPIWRSTLVNHRNIRFRVSKKSECSRWHQLKIVGR